MKKLIIIIICLNLTGCSSYPMGTDSELVDNIIESVKINGIEKSIEYTDDNTGEDLIIKSDNSDYGVFAGTFNSYYTVTNLAEGQNIKTVFSFNKDFTYKTYESDGTEFIQILDVPRYYSTSTGKWIEDTYKQIEQTKWIEMGLSDFTDEPVNTKSINNYSRIKNNTFYLGKNETKKFKAAIKYTPDGREEFFIEAFGDKGAIGHLDPWAYEQNFDGLNSATLIGQDSWTKIAALGDEPEVQSTVKFGNSGKSVKLDGHSTSKRVISTIDSGTFYFTMRADTKNSGDGGFLQLRDASDGYITLIKFDDVAGTLKILAYVGSGNIEIASGLSLTTQYVIKVKFNTDTDKTTIDWKEEGGSFSSNSEVDAVTAGDCTQIRIGSDTSWVSYIDEISANDPDEGEEEEAAPSPSIFIIDEQ